MSCKLRVDLWFLLFLVKLIYNHQKEIWFFGVGNSYCICFVGDWASSICNFPKRVESFLFELSPWIASGEWFRACQPSEGDLHAVLERVMRRPLRAPGLPSDLKLRPEKPGEPSQREMKVSIALRVLKQKIETKSSCLRKLTTNQVCCLFESNEGRNKVVNIWSNKRNKKIPKRKTANWNNKQLIETTNS